MSARLAERAAGFLGRRLDRRGFLARSAVVGSAVVAAPLEYGLKPQSAYAAVCGCNGSRCPCGSLCCDGYTEFCCTLTGQNACPPGTVTGGWWKVDGSQFCGGTARYYMDCNSQCGPCGCGPGGICDGRCSGTPCGCANGDCNNRKSGCVRFRYGQCHQDIPCLGPIVCRIVTCTPPWLFDPACGTSSRTDNNTRFHDRPCLRLPFGAIDRVVDVGGALRVIGWAMDQSNDAPVQVDVYVDLQLVSAVKADIARADVAQAFPQRSGNHGYDVTVTLPAGPHLVCVYVHDTESPQTQFLGVVSAPVAGPAGNVDDVVEVLDGTLRVRGWAIDPVTPNTPVEVRLRVDNMEVVRGLAELGRPDVGAARPEAGPFHGFEFLFGVAPGPITICLDALTPRGEVQLTCVNVEVP